WCVLAAHARRRRRGLPLLTDVFVTSRRRHTRCLSACSSDVCYSDPELAYAFRFLPLRLSWRQEPPRVGQLDNGQGREGGILRIDERRHARQCRGGAHRIALSDVEPRYVLQCRDELGLNFQHILKRSHRFAPRASHERSPMQQLVGEPELAEEKILRVPCQRLQGVESDRQGQALRPNQS